MWDRQGVARPLVPQLQDGSRLRLTASGARDLPQGSLDAPDRDKAPTQNPAFRLSSSKLLCVNDNA